MGISQRSVFLSELGVVGWFRPGVVPGVRFTPHVVEGKPGQRTHDAGRCFWDKHSQLVKLFFRSVIQWVIRA